MDTLHSSTIKISRGTFIPKFDGKFFQKPPSPIDWIQQSYIELIEDTSLTTMNYYESKVDNETDHATDDFVPPNTKHFKKEHSDFEITPDPIIKIAKPHRLTK
jgi:hypothetical protein